MQVSHDPSCFVTKTTRDEYGLFDGCLTLDLSTQKPLVRSQSFDNEGRDMV